MHLNKKLQKWQENGLITAEQITRILDFENHKNTGNWMTVLFCFSAFLVGLGIVAEVAANWQEIPNVVKLVGMLVLLVINAGIALYVKVKNMPIAFASCMVVFCMMIMAAIGLIGQVFHLRSDFDGAMLFWSGLTFSLLFALPNLIWIWLPIFYNALIYKLHTITSIPVLNIALWGVLTGVIVYESLANLRKFNQVPAKSAMRWFCGIALLLLLECYDTRWSGYGHKFDYYMVDLIFTGATALYVFAINKYNNRRTFMTLFLFGIMIFACQKFFVLPTLWFCSMLALYAYANRRPRLFNLAVLLAVLRILSFYMESGDLVFVGIKLIVSGIVLILTLWLLRKYGKLLWKGTL